MARELGWIRQFQAPRTDSLPPLIVFPHAGAGASAYRVFAKRMSQDFDTVIVQYPGRQDRAREAAAETLPELAAGAFEAFRASAHDTGAPVTVFGHSMGSLVAFEFVRLAEAAGLSVRLLVTSAAAAPHRIADLPGHPTEDEELLDHMATLNGTGADVMGSRDVMRMALPVLKADYRAFDAYSCGTDVQVAAPLLVLGGDDDPFVGPRDLYAWETNTSGGIEVNLFEGGHFYLDENLDAVAEALAGQAISR
ncbi:thioesterase [Nocardia asteroides NBRC 15531]|uniref:Thioesterase TesA n=2 Tax=Nocardia asteroides TaxID=1824 RepID=U5EBK7_NOCAS|nr:alpha/beta fold hydrolase [Nocardia asteroides]TLF65440.1 thioesterase [Nocardia asteroides NBRC 15531]UGT47804.1 alpha/beta fold hydrolase [Nocardia asteroides]SFM56134.1 Surfactin synthase thioesterase subunit [Nocardia asteroides]VEG33271.1 Phenyloxazoline synthase MbtB [Nocardia asteroides]BAO99087.1 thioesterase [Nocardia asteroides]